jgi:hypothetical protein
VQVVKLLVGAPAKPGQRQQMVPAEVTARVETLNKLVMISLQNCRASREWMSLLNVARNSARKALRLLKKNRQALAGVPLVAAALHGRSRLNAAAAASAVGRHMEALEHGRAAAAALHAAGVASSGVKPAPLEGQAAARVAEEREVLELEVLAYHTIGAQHEHLQQPGDCLAAYAKCAALATAAGLEGSSGLGLAAAEVCSICPPPHTSARRILAEAREHAAQAVREAQRRFVGYRSRSTDVPDWRSRPDAQGRESNEALVQVPTAGSPPLMRRKKTGKARERVSKRLSSREALDQVSATPCLWPLAFFALVARPKVWWPL